MNKKDKLTFEYDEQLRAIEAYAKEQKWQEVTEACKSAISIAYKLIPLASSPAETERLNAKLSSLRKLYVDIVKTSAKSNSTTKTGEDDVDPFGVKYVIDGVDVRDFIIDVADDIAFDDVCGMEKQKKIISEIWKWKEHEDFYDRLGCHPHKFHLLYGAPGTGKTFLAKAALSEVKKRSGGKVPAYSLNESAMYDCKFGATEKNVYALLEFIRQHDEFVLFVDEIEMIACDRTTVTFHEESRISAFINMLITLVALPGKLIIGATAYPHQIDPAMLSRMSSKIEFSLPDFDDAYAMLVKKLGSRVDNVDLEKVATRLVEGAYSRRDINNFIECAIDKLAYEYLAAYSKGEKRDFNEIRLTYEMLEGLFREIVSTTRAANLDFIKKFKNNI
jgi:SpoVK/Ycf46/Vps4 family AAA+-type ATPase